MTGGSVLTVPVPVPALTTETVTALYAAAIMSRSSLSVSLHTSAVESSQGPLRQKKIGLGPASGVAVSVTSVPFVNFMTHGATLSGHSVAPGLAVTLRPSPAT